MTIYYKPKISYKLDELPPIEKTDKVLNPDYHVPVEEIIDYDEELNLNIDFIIHLCEKELSKKDGFEEYREVAKEKYYCLNPLDTEQRSTLNEFENSYQDTTKYDNGDTSNSTIVSYLYPRALQLKRDIEMDIEEDYNFKGKSDDYLINLFDDSISNIKKYTDKLDAEDLGKKLIIHEDYDPVDKSHREKIRKLNQTLDDYEYTEDKLKEAYGRAINNGNKNKARDLQNAISNIKSDRSNLTQEVSHVASATETLFRKSEETDSYIQKMAYMLLASPADKLNQSVCCMLKLLIKQLDIEDELDSLDVTIGKDFYKNFHKNVPLTELRKMIKAMRILLTIQLYASGDKLNKFLNKIVNMLLSPVRTALDTLINILMDVKRRVVSRVENGLSSILQSNMENPDNILDCIHFEGFADLLVDGMEDINEEIEGRLLDLYKFVHERTKKYTKDIIELGKNDKMRQIHRVLGDFDELLGDIDKFIYNLSRAGNLSGKDGIENIVTKFLHDIGLDTTYNSTTGRYEAIDLDDCLDTGEDMDNYFHYLPDKKDDLNEINLREDRQYKDFIENNPGGLEIACRDIGTPKDYKKDIDVEDFANS